MDLVETTTSVIGGVQAPQALPGGVFPQMYGKNSREQWKYDMHRSVFGQLDQTPYKHHIQDVHANRRGPQKVPITADMMPAGVKTWIQVDKAPTVKAIQELIPQQQQVQQRQPDEVSVASQAPSSTLSAYTSKQDKSNEELLNYLRNKIVSRGVRGINGLKRVFRIMDDDGSKSLSLAEFGKAMQDYRIFPADSLEVSRVFNLFDRDGSGTINYDEFLRQVVGEMNDRRMNLVFQSFQRFDRGGNGTVSIEDLKGTYNASMHPDVRSGKKTEEDVLYEFLDTFEQHYSLLVRQNSNPSSIQDRDSRDRKLTLQEFVEYYTNISASIDNDDYFELMIRNAWNL